MKRPVGELMDLAHPFLTGSSLVTANPTYLSFRVTF